MAGRDDFLCLDFSLGQLTALEIRRGQIRGWLSHSLPAAALPHGDPVDPERLGKHIRNLLVTGGLGGKRARIALSDESSVTQVVRLPRMPQRDLQSAVRFAAERRLPFPQEKASWSWDVIARESSGLSILLAGAWKDVVRRFDLLAKSAELSCDVLEPRALAVGRALSLRQALVLDSYQGRVQMTVVSQGQPPFVEHTDLGTDRTRWTAILEGMMQHAVRHHSAAGVSTMQMPVVLAGELEATSLAASTTTMRASEVLNGHKPSRPAGMPAGVFLANLGLAMRRRG